MFDTIYTELVRHFCGRQYRHGLLDVADHPKPATLAHVPVHQLSQRAINAHAHSLDRSSPNHTLSQQVQAKILDILRIQIEVVVINIAGNIAFDPGQVVSCHAVLLLGR